jgi:hypothetical protein
MYIVFVEVEIKSDDIFGGDVLRFRSLLDGIHQFSGRDFRYTDLYLFRKSAFRSFNLNAHFAVRIRVFIGPRRI